MRSQPIPLDVIEVKQPCNASWEGMRGDDRMRFCEGCGRHVRNLSAMTRAEAEQVLEGCSPNARLCVRFGRLPDGAVQTLDYPSAPARRGRGWRFWTALGACLAGGVAAVNAVVFRNHLPPPFGRPQPIPTFVMGDFAPISPAPAPQQAQPIPPESDAPASQPPQS